jgi:macrolide transport system ATP-binding/permease protein
MAAERYDMPVTYAARGEPIVRMRGITKVFHGATGDAAVLKGIDVELRQGEFVAVVGRSGSGKSTLVNMLTGMTGPRRGPWKWGASGRTRWPRARWRSGAAAIWGLCSSSFNSCPC